MSFSRLGTFQSTLGDPVRHNNPMPSTIMQNNIALTSNRNINMGGLENSQTIISRDKIIFIRMQADLKMYGGDQLFGLLNERYQQRLYFRYFDGYSPILEIKFAMEPVSILVTTFQTRTWARRFVENEKEHRNFRIFMVCNSEAEMREVQSWMLPNIVHVFANGWVDVLYRSVAIEYQNYGHDYIIGTDKARRDTKYFYRYNNNQVLNIYYSAKLQPMLNKVGKQFLKSPRFKNTRLKSFTTLEELLVKFNDRRKVRKSTISRMSQISSIGGTIRDPDKIQQKLMVDSETQKQKNLILIDSTHPQYEQIRVMVQDDKKDRWEMIVFGTGNQWERHVPMMPIPQANTLLMPEWQREQIVAAEELIVIIFIDDIETAYEFQQLQNINFHSNLLKFDTPETLQTIMRQLADNPKDFGLLILYEDRYEDFRDIIGKYIYENSDNPIHNIKILLKMRDAASLSIASFPGERGSKSYLNHGSLSDIGVSRYQASYFISPEDILGEQNPNILNQIFTYRNLYYHPAKGLMGRKVELLINKNREFLIRLCEEVCTHNRRRLAIQTWNDSSHLNYLVRRVKPHDNVVVVTTPDELPFVMRQIGGIFGVHAVVVTDVKAPKVPAQVLKQGTPRQIQQFLMLIEQPIEDRTYISQKTYTDIRVVESNLGGIGMSSQRSLQRLGFEDELIVPNRIVNKKKIVVRIPDSLDSDNVSLLETKLFNHYGDQIAFKYYTNTEQIRDMDKWEQPLQFLIVTDEPSMLRWMEVFAINEANQRFQIIVYTMSPSLNHLAYLTQDQRLRRFKLVSNSWTEIEQYIIGRDSRSINMSIYPNQKLRLVLSVRDKVIQQQLVADATMGNPIAQRCTYEYYDDTNPSTLISAMQQIPIAMNEPVVVIVNESRQTAVTEQVAANILQNYSTFVKVLVIYPMTNSRLYMLPRTATVVVNQLEAVRWIENIKFMGSISALPPPVILVSRNNQYWRNYLNRISLRRNLKYQQFTEDGQLKMLIDQILSTPNQTVWILLNSKEEYQYYRKIGLSIGRNVGYIVHSPAFQNPIQTQDLIFGSNDPEEIEMFLLNYQKKSTFLLSPSHLRPNRRVTLIANRSIGLDQRELEMWTRLPGATIRFYDHQSTLRKTLDEERQSNIFVIYTYSEDMTFGDAISKYPNVRRVVFNPEFKPRPYFEHSSVAFVGQSNVQLAQFLTTLRYLLRNPPYQIRNDYTYPITNIFVPTNILSPSFLQSLIVDNESIMVYFYNSPQQLLNKYNLVYINCNNLILGDDNIQNLVRSQNLLHTSKFINFTRSTNDIRGNTILSTQQIDEILLYLRNIPMTRYNTLRTLNGLTGIYYDSNSFKRINGQIDQLPNYNPAVNIYKYTDIRQIEKNLRESKQSNIFILLQPTGDYQSQLAYLESIISKMPNKNIRFLILSDNPNIRLTPYRTIIDRQDILMRYMSHIPTVTQQNILISQRIENAPVVTKQSVTEDVVLVFGKRKPAMIINQTYVKAERPPITVMDQTSRVARSWVQPNHLSKFTILKSVNPAIGLNLVQEVVHAAIPQIKTSQPDVSRLDRFRTIVKPAYQIIHKNRATPLLLQQDLFMQQSPRVEIGAAAIIKDQSMKILQKPMIPTVRRVTVTHTPSPPKAVVVSQVVAPQIVTSTLKTKIISHTHHVAHLPCKVALFFSDTPQGQRHADFIIRNTDEDRSINAIPFNNIAQVGDILERDYNLYDEIIILLDSQHSDWANVADQITNRFRRARWFILDESNPDSFTKISLVFNLGWAWKELEYPYKNQNFALEQYNNIRLIIPQPFFRDYSRNIGPGAEVYSSPHQILPILERNLSHHTFNVVVIPYSMLSLVYRLPFKYQNLRYVVIDDVDPSISQRMLFDNYGEMFWIYAHKSLPQIQQYLQSLLIRRSLLNGTLLRNVLFYQLSEQNIAFSLLFLGYFKQPYLDLRDLQQKINNLKPNEIPFILRLIGNRWIAEKQNKSLKKVTKVNIPRSNSVSKVVTRPRYRPWILPNGQFIQDTDEEGRRKKILLVKMFNIDVFSKYNDFRFYYLTASPTSLTPGRDIVANTADMIFAEATQNPQAMFLIFLDKGEERHLRPELAMNPRVQLIRISDQHYQNQLHIRADECQPVIERIKSIQRNSQIRYVLYRGGSNNSELKLQELLMHQRNIEQVEYNSMRQFESQIGRLQGKYRQIDVIVFDQELMEAKRVLDLFKINPYKLISIRRDARDRDSERNSENQLRIDSRLGANPSYQRKNSLGLLEAVQQLGNLQNVVMLVDASSNERDRITGILGNQLSSRVTLFNSQPIMRSLTEQFISKPVIILSDRSGVSDFAEGRNAVLYIECNPNSQSTGYRNTFVLRDWQDLQGLARVLKQYVPIDSLPSEEITELRVENSKISQKFDSRSNIDMIADQLTPDLNGHPIAIYLPRDRMISWKADLITRQNIMILAYTDQPEIQKYLRRYEKSLSLILLPPNAVSFAKDLQQYPLARLIAEPGDYDGMNFIEISSSVELDDLMDKLSRRNQQKDRQRIEMDLHRLSRTQSDKIGYSMTLTLRSQKQKIYIFLTEKNITVRPKVQETNSARVVFEFYKGVKDLDVKLRALGDNIGIIVQNDHQIEDIQRLVSTNNYLKLYLIRHYSNPLLASKDSIPSHDKVIHTAVSNKEIANHINSLIYRSFKNYERMMKQSKTKKSNDSSRTKPPTTTFGTTERFDNDEHRNYSRQNSNKILTRVLSPGGTKLL